VRIHAGIDIEVQRLERLGRPWPEAIAAGFVHAGVDADMLGYRLLEPGDLLALQRRIEVAGIAGACSQLLPVWRIHPWMEMGPDLAHTRVGEFCHQRGRRCRRRYRIVDHVRRFHPHRRKDGLESRELLDGGGTDGLSREWSRPVELLFGVDNDE